MIEKDIDMIKKIMSFSSDKLKELAESSQKIADLFKLAFVLKEDTEIKKGIKAETLSKTDLCLLSKVF